MTAAPGRRPDRTELARLAPEPVLARLELAVVRRLEGMLHGEHLGLLPGPGSELAEARPYRPGEDDVRQMDWSVTARTTVPHVRDVIADRELETWALVDLSASMDFGTVAVEKRQLAVAALATVGFITNRMGDRFGGYVVRGGRLHRWPARSGRLALYGLLRSVLRQSETTTPKAEDDLTSALDRLARAHPRRGLRVVVSDYLDGWGGGAGPTWERPLRQLSVRHQVLAVEVLDPRELALPDVGVVLLADPETGGVREVDTGDARLRDRYAAAAARQRDAVRDCLRRCGAAHLRLRTDRDWVADTARFVLAHRRIAQRLHGARAPGPGACGPRSPGPRSPGGHGPGRRPAGAAG